MGAQALDGATAMSERDDITLLAAVAHQRDETAFDELCERHQRPMFSVAFRILRNAALAEDAVQEALLSIWLAKSAHPKGDTKDWILKIVIHKSIDLRRSRTQSAKREERLAMEQSRSEAAFPENVDADETCAVLRHHIDQLPELERTLLACSYCTSLSHREIARLVGIPDRTVTDKIHQALDRLRMDLTKAGVAAVVPLLSRGNLFEAMATGQECPSGMTERLKKRIRNHESTLKSARSVSTVNSAIVTALILAGAAAFILYRGSGTPAPQARSASVVPAPTAARNAGPLEETGSASLAEPAQCSRTAERLSTVHRQDLLADA